MSTPYTGPERRDSELHDLRLATERLTEQVATLSLALQVVNVLQGKQQEMATEAAEQRDLTTLMIDQVSTDVDANARSRRRFWRQVLPATGLVLLALSSVYLVNNHRLAHNCQQRNAQAKATHDLLVMAIKQTAPGAYRDQEVATNKLYEPLNCGGLL